VAGGGSIWPRGQRTSEYASGLASQAGRALVHCHQPGCSPAGRRALPEADEDRAWLSGLEASSEVEGHPESADRRPSPGTHPSLGYAVLVPLPGRDQSEPSGIASPGQLLGQAQLLFSVLAVIPDGSRGGHTSG
jgi:hypothetical protein